MKIHRTAALLPLALAGLLVLGGCEDRDAARRVLTQDGYTNIEFLGPALFACSEDDTFRTRFRAVNDQGVRVEGVVCGGWLKGSTVRRF